MNWTSSHFLPFSSVCNSSGSFNLAQQFSPQTALSDTIQNFMPVMQLLLMKNVAENNKKLAFSLTNSFSYADFWTNEDKIRRQMRIFELSSGVSIRNASRNLFLMTIKVYKWGVFDVKPCNRLKVTVLDTIVTTYHDEPFRERSVSLRRAMRHVASFLFITKVGSKGGS